MQEKHLIPFSIIVSALIFGISLYFINLSNKSSEEVIIKKIKKEDNTNLIKPVDPLSENIKGSKDAALFVITYSDFECPGCKAFYNMEKDLISKYAANDKIGFVFRHFPLYKAVGVSDPIHPTAGVEARATECAKKIAGEKKFWEMTEKIFDTTNSDGKYPVENLPKLAESIGIDGDDFSDCISSEEIKEKIENDWKNAVNSGIEKTPTVFIQIGKNNIFKSYPSKDILDKAIKTFLENN